MAIQMAMEMFDLSSETVILNGFLHLRSDTTPTRHRANSDFSLATGSIDLKSDCGDSASTLADRSTDCDSSLADSDAESEAPIIARRSSAPVAAPMPPVAFCQSIMSLQPCFVMPMQMPVAVPLATEPADPAVTSLMVRNIPNNMTRLGLMQLFGSLGFKACYNFLYLPMDLERSANLGYAFVCLISRVEARRFKSALDGFNNWPGKVTSKKVTRVQWSTKEKGLQDHVARYRNSPLMHESVPDECRPVLLRGGVPVAFPSPTKAVSKPRNRIPLQKQQKL